MVARSIEMPAIFELDADDPFITLTAHVALHWN